MGVYSEYLDDLKGFQAITAERKKQIARIASIRKRPIILTFARDLQKRGPILIDYSDILPIADQINNLSGNKVEETGQLNRAYVPILQDISPGEIQSCENAQKFSSTLVTKWLAQYKFKQWVKSGADAPTIGNLTHNWSSGRARLSFKCVG